MTAHPGVTFPAYVRAFLESNQRGLGYYAALCYVHMHELLNFPTGPLRNDDLRNRIEATKNAAETACALHDAANHDKLLFEWRLAVSRFYAMPRHELCAEDCEAFFAFEKLVVSLNSRIWLDT